MTVEITETESGNGCPIILTRTWTATDECGNSKSTSQIITIHDTTAPSVTPAADVTIECTDAIPAADYTTNDNCNDVTVDISVVAAGDDCLTTITRTYVPTDACGNVGAAMTQVITIQDTTAPTVDANTVPGDVSIECDDPIPAVGAQPTFTDDCSNLDVEYLETESGDDCPRIITRTWTATDDCGNSTSSSQTITINDTTTPIVDSTPADLTIECGEEIPEAEPIFSDNCDNDLTIESTETGEVDECPTTITRTWTATDDCGNSVTTTQTITINDETAAITVDSTPDNVSIECDDNSFQGEPTFSHACEGELTVEITETESGNGCTIILTRTWTATDECGNSKSTSQIITIHDTTAPSVTPAADVTIECTDAIPAADYTTNDNCNDVTVDISVVAAGDDCLTTITRTYVPTDACGNVGAAMTQVITIQDTTAPTVDQNTVPGDVSIECDDPIPAVGAQPTFTDDCSNLDVEYLETEVGTCPKVLTRTWTATDDCGNSTSSSQTITINDTTTPIVDSTPADLTIECGEEIPEAEPIFSDNCDDDLTIESTETGEVDECPTTITRTWTATDDCGNSVSCYANNYCR